MKMKYLISSLIIIIISFNTTVTAQSYNTGLGIRLGGLTSGITVKHFTNSQTALEGILSVGRKSFIVTGLFEKHSPTSKNSSLKFLYGFGAHVGFFSDGGSYYYNDNRRYTATTVLGIDGIVGLDYKFNKAPINLTMDLKPFVDFFGGNYIYMDGGISLRYTF